jgi:hypothetical protein
MGPDEYKVTGKKVVCPGGTSSYTSSQGVVAACALWAFFRIAGVSVRLPFRLVPAPRAAPCAPVRFHAAAPLRIGRVSSGCRCRVATFCVQWS